MLVVALRPRRRVRKSAASAVPPQPAIRMTRAEAFSVLGLKEGANGKEVMRAYKRLMLKVHPDHGGSEYLAAKLNQARELLLK